MKNQIKRRFSSYERIQFVFGIIIIIIQSLLVKQVVASGALSIIPTPDTNNNIIAAFGESFVLSCLASGSSEEKPKALQWYSPNNVVIPADTNKRVYTELKGDTLRLFFDKLIDFDAGLYRCVGIQAGEQREVHSTLVLQKKIKFLNTKTDQWIKGGLDQTVVCQATSEPGPEVAYFRKGINVELKNEEITIDSAISSNDTSDNSSTSTSSYSNSSSISDNSSDNSSSSDDASNISLDETKSDSTYFKTLIVNDAKYQPSNEGLIIKNAQPEDEGIYICQASVTSTGEVKRLEINVQVASAPRWVIEPKDTEGVRNKDVILKCEARAKPAPVYQWFRNGILLGGDRYSMNGGSLTITNLVKEDTGTYSCVVENDSGKLEGVLNLAVLVGPEIARLEDINVVEGSKTFLRCDVNEAYPKAVIRWKYADTQEFINDSDASGPIKISHDSNNANQIGSLVGSWSELHFERVSRTDKRNYTCVAENKAAVAEHSVQLLVEYVPKLIINNEAREVYYSWILTDDYGNSGNTASQSTRGYQVTFTCLADGEPKPLITWYFQGQQIRDDAVKYKLLIDQSGYSKLEVNPKTINDFGDYQCRAENRLGKEDRNIQLKLATPPQFAPLIRLKQTNPESVLLDIDPSDATDADGGMPIESYKIQWRFSGTEWTTANEKEVTVDLSNQLAGQSNSLYNVEIDSLVPDTDYYFRVAARNKPGLGVWSTQDLKIKTAPRRQPDPVRVLSKEDCHASTRCYIEWTVDSNGGSLIKEYLIRWRRITYKDPLFTHVNTDRIEAWSPIQIVKSPITNYEISQLKSNSFYEVEVLAKNAIGLSASQPFRIRTTESTPEEAEEFLKQNAPKTNRGVIIAASVLGAIILFLIIDVICLIKSNCGILALLRKFCDEDKANSSEYKTKSPPPKIAQHQPKPSSATHQQSKVQYQPIKTTNDTNNGTTNGITNISSQQKVTIPMND